MNTIFVHPFIFVSSISFCTGVAVFLFSRLSLARLWPLGVSFFGRLKSFRKSALPWPRLIDGKNTIVQRTLNWAGYGRLVPKISLLAYLLGAGLIILTFLGGIKGLLFGSSCSAIFFFAIFARAKKRRSDFVRELPEALQSLIDTMRAGYSFPQATNWLAAEASPLMQSVFAALARAETLGVDRSVVLNRLDAQLAVREWSTVTAMLVAHADLGGNLIPLLEDITKTLRDQINVASEVQTFTAAGRMSGYLIAGLVPSVLLFFFLASPMYLAVMFKTLLGQTLLSIALILEVIGWVWIRQIVNVDY